MAAKKGREARRSGTASESRDDCLVSRHSADDTPLMSLRAAF